MEERDDWKLGDEEGSACPRCGKLNRAGLSYCAICGSPIRDGLEADPSSLRTLGEAMGSARPVRHAAAQRSLRAWTIAASVLLVLVVVLTWLQTREEPFLLEDWLAAEEEPTPAASRTERTAVPPTQHPQPTSPPPRPTRPPPPPAAIVPPEAAAMDVARPTATAVVRATAVPQPTTTPRTAWTRTRPVVATPRPTPRPLVQKPSLGTDLEEASRLYRRAVDLHNARVDEYNALADEIQRRNAWDDSEASVELRRRLDRAREGVESARAEAEVLRAKMEALRARYR